MYLASYTSRCCLALAALAAGFLSLASPALATEPTDASADSGASTEDHAEDQQNPVEAALSAMAGGDYDQACPALRQIARKDRTPKNLFRMAECYEKWKKVATAHLAYGDYLEAVEKLEEPIDNEERERMREASARHDALEKRLPWVTLQLPENAPPNTVVTRVGTAGGPRVRISVGRPLAMDPGEHVVQAQLPAGEPMFTKWVIREGERKTVVLKVDLSVPRNAKVEKPNARPVKIPDDVFEQPTPKRRIVAWGLGIAGTASILTGAITGAMTWAQKSTIAAECQRTPEAVCDVPGQDAINRGRITGLISTVAFPVGLVALGAGITLYVTEPSPSPNWMTAQRVDLGVRVWPGQTTFEVRAQW